MLAKLTVRSMIKLDVSTQLSVLATSVQNRVQVALMPTDLISVSSVIAWLVMMISYRLWISPINHDSGVFIYYLYRGG